MVIISSQLEQIERLVVPNLKGYLKNHGLPTGGKKADLVDRIKHHVKTQQWCVHTCLVSAVAHIDTPIAQEVELIAARRLHAIMYQPRCCVYLHHDHNLPFVWSAKLARTCRYSVRRHWSRVITYETSVPKTTFRTWSWRWNTRYRQYPVDLASGQRT